MHKETIFVHGGTQYDNETKAKVTPISLATTYIQEEPGVSQHEYSRCSNPTRNTMEKCMAECEYAQHCVSFSSGLAAIHAILAINKDLNILTIDDLYGGTFRMFENKDYQIANINYIKDDFSNIDNIYDIIINNDINMVWIESPTNPLLKVVDLQKLSEIIKNAQNILNKKIYYVVDNTFATPYLQNPLLLGADIVVHSATKYIGGHSDILMGLVMFNDDVLYDKIKKNQYCVGAVPSPFDCYLLLRSIKTLHVRLEKQIYNCRNIYEYLIEKKKLDKINNIYYPILPHNNSGTGMISFEINKSIEQIKQDIKNLKIIKIAESLGSTDTTINFPALMTHTSVSKEFREEHNITNNLLRMSVGIENITDLITDLNLII